MKLPNIQILRACAALMIVVYHCGIETARLSAIGGGSKLFDEAAWGSGVPLFFAISGFIMVVTSARAFGSSSAAIHFMRRRLIRIVPLYWLVTTVALVGILVVPSMSKAPPGDPLYIVASYLFWPYMRLTGDIRPLATPGWTLNLEMLFYVVFAVSLLFRRRAGLSLLFASLGLLVAARVSGLLPGVALNFWGDLIVLGFLLGRRGNCLCQRIATVGLVGCHADRDRFWHHVRVLGSKWRRDSLALRLTEAAPATLVLIGIALGPQVDANRNVWQFGLAIGNASYSLYLVQEFLLRLLSLSWFKGPLGYPLWTFIPIGIAITVLVALAIYRYFEKPVTAWLNGDKNRQSQRIVDRLRRPLAGETAAV